MNNELINGTRLLGKGHIRHVHGDKGRRVELVSGSLWITQDGDPRDIVLAPGESVVLERSTPTIVQAFEPALITIADPVPVLRTRSIGGWLAQLRGVAERLPGRPAWA